MNTYTYPVIAFRQQADSPVQVAFVAPAAEIMSWAGTPRKSDELLTGYQRFRDDDRVNQQIVPYFQDPKNCSPTAVIVALRSDSGVGSCRLEKLPQDPGEIIFTRLIISIDDAALNSDGVFEAAIKYVGARIRQDTEAASQSVDSRAADEEDEENEDEFEAEESEIDAEAEVVHLGSETLAEMHRLLSDRKNWANPNFRKAIRDYVLPSFLIDGQHRTAAAARIGAKGLPFLVCGLYDAPWEEQVFQFTIVNVKPKRIPPSLITSIAALSLSRSEQNKLTARLSQAGIKMDEVEIMSLVAYDDESPFAQLVDMGVVDGTAERNKLGYGGVKRLAKVWYRASRNSLTQIGRSLFQTNSPSKARVKWRSDRYWFTFFCEFWNTVRAHYPAALWAKTEGNKLFVAAHLWALQEAILAEADGQMPSFWKIEEDSSDDDRLKSLLAALKLVTSTCLVYIPAEIWTAEWAKASQDTNQGREELRQLFSRFIDEGKKLGKPWSKWKAEKDWFV